MTKTVNELMRAIREADSLDELKGLASPTDEQAIAAARRLEIMDSIWNRYGSFNDMPIHDRDRYYKLQVAQTEYENLYC